MKELSDEGKSFIMKGDLMGYTHKDKGPSFGVRVAVSLHVFLFDDIIISGKTTNEKKKIFDDVMAINDGFVLHQHPRINFSFSFSIFSLLDLSFLLLSFPSFPLLPISFPFFAFCNCTFVSLPLNLLSLHIRQSVRIYYYET